MVALYQVVHYAKSIVSLGSGLIQLKFTEKAVKLEM